MQFNFGWFAAPVFKDGQYPAEMREYVDRNSEEQGLPQSRLPHFTPEELYLKDYFKSELISDGW